MTFGYPRESRLAKAREAARKAVGRVLTWLTLWTPWAVWRRRKAAEATRAEYSAMLAGRGVSAETRECF